MEEKNGLILMVKCIIYIIMYYKRMVYVFCYFDISGKNEL